MKISHHLGVLRHAAVVQTEKQGRYVIYSLHADVAAVDNKESMGQDNRIDFGCCSIDLPST